MMYRLAQDRLHRSPTPTSPGATPSRSLTEYLTELTTTAPRPTSSARISSSTRRTSTRFSCRRSGRAGLSHPRRAGRDAVRLWGVYNGFELCEAAPLPGREEYLDFEKYEFSAWDLDRRRQHRRRDHRAQRDPHGKTRRCRPISGITFLQRLQRQDHLLREGGAGPQRSLSSSLSISIRIARRSCDIESAAVGMGPARSRRCRRRGPASHGHSFTWHGKMQRVRLDPASSPSRSGASAPLEDRMDWHTIKPQPHRS